MGSLIFVVAWELFCGMWDLVPWPRIEPGPPALGVWSLRHRTTREVPWSVFWITGSVMDWCSVSPSFEIKNRKGHCVDLYYVTNAWLTQEQKLLSREHIKLRKLKTQKRASIKHVPHSFINAQRSTEYLSPILIRVVQYSAFQYTEANQKQWRVWEMEKKESNCKRNQGEEK